VLAIVDLKIECGPADNLDKAGSPKYGSCVRVSVIGSSLTYVKGDD
jgi:hypothetical protein